MFQVSLPILLLITLVYALDLNPQPTGSCRLRKSVLAGRTCIFEYKSSRPGGVLRTLTLPTFSECVAACVAEPDCKGVDYIRRTNQCELKSVLNDAISTLDVDGVVCDAVPSSSTSISIVSNASQVNTLISSTTITTTKSSVATTGTSNSQPFPETDSTPARAISFVAPGQSQPLYLDRDGTQTSDVADAVQLQVQPDGSLTGTTADGGLCYYTAQKGQGIVTFACLPQPGEISTTFSFVSAGTAKRGIGETLRWVHPDFDTPDHAAIFASHQGNLVAILDKSLMKLDYATVNLEAEQAKLPASTTSSSHTKTSSISSLGGPSTTTVSSKSSSTLTSASFSSPSALISTSSILSTMSTTTASSTEGYSSDTSTSSIKTISSTTPSSKPVTPTSSISTLMSLTSSSISSYTLPASTSASSSLSSSSSSSSLSSSSISESSSSAKSSSVSDTLPSTKSSTRSTSSATSPPTDSSGSSKTSSFVLVLSTSSTRASEGTLTKTSTSTLTKTSITNTSTSSSLKTIPNTSSAISSTSSVVSSISTTTSSATRSSSTSSTSTAPYCSRYTQYSNSGKCGVHTKLKAGTQALRSIWFPQSIEHCFYAASLDIPDGSGTVFYDPLSAIPGLGTVPVCSWARGSLAATTDNSLPLFSDTLCAFEQSCVSKVAPVTACSSFKSSNVAGATCNYPVRGTDVNKWGPFIDSIIVGTIEECIKYAQKSLGLDPSIGSISFTSGSCQIYNTRAKTLSTAFDVTSPICLFDLACDPSLVVFSSSAKTVVPASNGLFGDGGSDFCFSNGECASKFCNSQHSCGYLNNGMKCYYDNECKSNSCTNIGSFGGTCAKPAGSSFYGEACSADNDCASRSCYRAPGQTTGQCRMATDRASNHCLSQGDCASNMWCDQYGWSGSAAEVPTWSCYGKFDDGHWCRGNEQCRNGYCNSYKTCGKIGLKSQCAKNDDCSSGFCYMCDERWPGTDGYNQHCIHRRYGIDTYVCVASANEEPAMKNR